MSVMCGSAGDMVDCSSFWSGCQLLHKGFEVQLLIVQVEEHLVLGMVYDSKDLAFSLNGEASMVATPSSLCTLKMALK